MSHENDIQEIQISIEHAREVVAFGEAIERLIRNKDFQTVIDEGYTTKEARRLTMLLGDPAIENKSPIMLSLQAIGEFHQYLRVQRSQAEAMKRGIVEAEEAIAEIEAAAAEEAGNTEIQA